jgi:hypothetical protein
MCGGMDAQKIRIGGEAGLPFCEKIHDAAGQQLVIDGIEPIRRFGMPVPHIMQPACGVSNIECLHKG